MANKSKGREGIYLGRKPADQRDAWRALTPEAKEALFNLRWSDDEEMGATPGRVPYWVSQEYGEPAAHVEARHFISLSLEAWRARLPMLIDRWLGL